LGLAQRPRRRPPVPPGGDDLAQPRLLLGEPLHPLAVGVGVGRGELLLQLGVAVLESAQAHVDVGAHRCTRGYEASGSGVSGTPVSPARAAARAAMATSIWESSGSRVVSRWVARTGTRSSRPGGVERIRASSRMPSEAIAATTGMSTIRLSTSHGTASPPKGAKTAMLTSATTT